MNDWISVNDRLPQMDQNVILTNGRTWLVARFQGIVNDNPTRWLWKWDRILDVAYWMPKAGALPPIPEEVKK